MSHQHLLAEPNKPPMIAQDLKSRVKNSAALGLPAHLMFLCIEWAVRKGFAIRADVMDHLNNAAAVPLIGLDELSVSRAAKLMDDTAKKVLHDINPESGTEGLAIVCTLMMVMIDEGLWADVRNQAVLVALLCIADMKAEDGAWSFSEHRLQARAKQLLTILRREGFYTFPVVDKAPVTSATLMGEDLTD